MTVDFGILTFVAVEREAICRIFGLGDQQREFVGSRVYWRGRVEGLRGGGAYEIVVAQSSDMASVDAVLLTNDLIRDWGPQKILAVGIAGAVDESVQLGDVVIGSWVYYYERGKLTDQGQRAEPYMYRADATLWNRVQAVAAWTESIPVDRPDELEQRPERHYGVIGSGEKVIASEAAREAIRAGQRKILAIEMEGYGVSVAAWGGAEQVGCLVIKAISDRADVAKDDRWQGYAATVAAMFARHFLRDRPIEPRAVQPGGDPVGGQGKLADKIGIVAEGGTINITNFHMD